MLKPKARELDQPAVVNELLRDFQRLVEAYEAAGLLDETTLLGASRRLIGDRQAVAEFRRLVYYSDALLRNVIVPQLNGLAGPPHVCVFGGTQVGKSTCINILAGSDAARVHHTAGFTRHAHGFVPPAVDSDAALADRPYAFNRLQLVGANELARANPLQFAIERLNNQPHVEAVLWDTPDCDAVDNSTYQQGLIEALTLADTVVYVTSREKYAVQIVLQWLRMSLDSGAAVTAVLNMTPSEQQRDLILDLRRIIDRISDGSRTQVEGIVVIGYVPEVDYRDLLPDRYAASDELVGNIKQLLHDLPARRARRFSHALDFLQSQAEHLIAPALAELHAADAWQSEITKATERFLEEYKTHYLDNPTQYDAFNRVGIEILALLDPPVPGLREAVSFVRKTLSLPARIIVAAGKMVWRLVTGQTAQAPPVTPPEVGVFKEAHERVLTDLIRSISANRAKEQYHPFWDALDRALQAQMDQIHQSFQRELNQHQEKSQQWIRDVAQGIFEELQKNPMRLNLLRSSRLAADAAAIVVSIKTGGPGDIIHDIVLAPALMSLVEAASQQVTANYLELRKEELRRQLYEDTVQFTQIIYAEPLMDLGRKALKETGLVQGMEEQIRTIPERLAELRRITLK